MQQVLKIANRKGSTDAVPGMAASFKTAGKAELRRWFSPEEYKILYEATRERAKHPLNDRWRTGWEDLHDDALFMANSGLRPDEAKWIEIRDIEVVTDGPNNERILHIAVRGRRGVGFCKTMPGALMSFTRMKKRHDLQPAPYVHMRPPHGRSRHLSDHQKLPHKRREDREISRFAHQNMLDASAINVCPPKA